jgi:hypothetical protein
MVLTIAGNFEYLLNKVCLTKDLDECAILKYGNIYVIGNYMYYKVALQK